MSDARVDRAQALHWEIEALKRLGAYRAALNVRRREAASLLEERAHELLKRREALGWTDLFAAVTYLGEAGERPQADRLLEQAEQYLQGFPDGADNLRQQLGELRTWLQGLRVVPSLDAFARPLPPLPELRA